MRHTVIGEVWAKSRWLAAVTAGAVLISGYESYALAQGGHTAGVCALCAVAGFALTLLVDLRSSSWQIAIGLRLGVVAAALTLTLAVFSVGAPDVRAPGAWYWTAAGLAIVVVVLACLAIPAAVDASIRSGRVYFLSR